MSKASWLVPSLIEGSGGHRTILQNADYLQRNGFSTIIYLESDSRENPRESLTDCIFRLFGYRFEDVRIGWQDIKPSELVFATIWYSAKVVRDLSFKCKKLYFIQDWEAYFNPVGDAYLLAENSYRYGLYPITIGNWLRHEIRSRFNVNSFSFDFCADNAIYRPLANVRKEKAICFICQPEKPRRCTIIGIEALGIVKHHVPDIKIYLYGSSTHVNTWFEHSSLGLLSAEECNVLYNRCLVGLCLSSSNPSRIPFEMMASGLPVVEIHRNNTLYDLPEDSTLLCDQTPESLAEGLIYIINNEAQRKKMSEAGKLFMSQKTIEHGMNQFRDAVIWVEASSSTEKVPTFLAEPFYKRLPVSAQCYVKTIPSQACQLKKINIKPKRKGNIVKLFLTKSKAIISTAMYLFSRSNNTNKHP